MVASNKGWPRPFTAFQQSTGWFWGAPEWPVLRCPLTVQQRVARDFLNCGHTRIAENFGKSDLGWGGMAHCCADPGCDRPLRAIGIDYFGNIGVEWNSARQFRIALTQLL